MATDDDGIVAAVAAQQAAQSAVQGLLAARLLDRSPSRADQHEPERLLTAEEVAQSLGVRRSSGSLSHGSCPRFETRSS